MTQARAVRPATVAERRIAYVSPEQRRERELEVERLMIAGVSQTRIEGAMRDRHGIGKSSVHSTMARVRRRWAEEERENRPSYKNTAMRRLLGTIAESRSAKNFAATAQLERLLAEMQGTREPIEMNVNVETTLPEAALQVAAQLTPEKFAAIVAEQRQLRALAAAKVTVDTVGTEKREPDERKPDEATALQERAAFARELAMVRVENASLTAVLDKLALTVPAVAMETHKP